MAQRLLGPSPFPLDRLLAILGALLEENDADARLPPEEFVIPGEYSDMEISRRGVHSSVRVSELYPLKFQQVDVDSFSRCWSSSRIA